MANIKFFNTFQRRELFTFCTLPDKNKDALIQKSIFVDKLSLDCEQLSFFQSEVIKRFYENRQTNLFLSRQFGKTTLLSWIIFQQMFENKSNSKIMLLGTSKASLGKIWYTQCLLPTLVGKFDDNDSINLSSYAVEGDMINYIYLSVKIPVVAEAFRDFAKKWGQYREDILNQYPEKRQSQAREDVEGTLHPELFNLLQKGALIISGDTYYIKFYVDTIDWKNKDDIIMGTLFNGTQVIHLGGNTPSTQQLLRGGQVQLCACDELGEFTGSITGSVLPAVISGKGRMIACGTPNSKGVLSTAIREALGVVTGSTSKQEEISGLRLYTAKKESPVFNDLGEIQKIDSYTETTIIGELEKIYPYGYDGINKFNAAQASRSIPPLDDINYLNNVPKIALPLKDHKGNVIMEKQIGTKVCWEDGKLQFTKEIKEVVKTKIDIHPQAKNHPKGLDGALTAVTYQTEYQINFTANISSSLTSFNPDYHVIDNFDPTPYRSIAGCDHGLGNSTGVDTRRSNSAYCKIAIVANEATGENQYIVWGADFLEDEKALTSEVMSEFAQLNREGMPIVLDNKLFVSTTASSRNADGTLNGIPEIIRMVKDYYLTNQDDNRDFDKFLVSGFSLFKSVHKGSDDQRIHLLNKLFAKENELYTDFKFHGDNKPLGYVPKKIYITRDCYELINSIPQVIYKKRSEGANSLVKFKDDVFDAFTYAIFWLEKDTKDAAMEIRWARMNAFWEYWDNKIKEREVTFGTDLQVFGIDEQIKKLKDLFR